MNFVPRQTALQRSMQAMQVRLDGFSRKAGQGADGALIPPGMTFVLWCEKLGRHGLKVDNRPFDLSTRPALREIYEAVPDTLEDGYGRTMAIIKGAQTGLTVMTMLFQIYMALRYLPAKGGVYYPDKTLASYTSSSRFMPVLRCVPVAHRLLTEASNGGEGNVLTRRIGDSEVIFLWTTGGIATESYPLDFLVFDEVQSMTISNIENVRERMSGSKIRFALACSTAFNPDGDIDHLFRKGDQRRFHTACACDDGVILEEVFPECIAYNGDGRWPEAPVDFVYCCPVCGTYIDDPQRGRWVRHNPSSTDPSFHFPQTLSPTVSPREIYKAFREARDMANFFRRKLGKPWTNPTQVPITLEICERQAELGQKAGLVWKDQAHGTFMGLDQMGGFNVVLILERMKDGRQAMVHAEFIYDEDPFARCDELMRQYGVAVCVVEQLPNINDARRFANRHRGRVFLAGYADLRDDSMQWGDQLTRSDRRTIEDDRSQYSVNLNQYKCMQTALFRIKDGDCLFPDPGALQQEVLDRGERRRVALLREVVFLHFTRVALVVKQDEHTRKPRAFVEKIHSDDPHAAYAFMLANVAWARQHGSGSIFLAGQIEPDRADAQAKIERVMPGLPANVVQMMTDLPTGVCGRCYSWQDGACTERGFTVAAAEPACQLFVAKR